MAINKNFIVKNGLDVNGDATVNGNLTVEGNVTVSSNGSLIIPAGDTASRPENPTSGDFRFNTELGEFEGYDGSEWGSIGGAAGGSVTLEQDFVSGEEVVIAATDFTFENPSVEVTEKLSQLNQVSTKLSPDASFGNYDILTEPEIANTTIGIIGDTPGIVTGTLDGASIPDYYEGGVIEFIGSANNIVASFNVLSVDKDGSYGYNVSQSNFIRSNSFDTSTYNFTSLQSLRSIRSGAFTFGDNGTKLYTGSVYGPYAYQFDLPVAYDLTSFQGTLTAAIQVPEFAQTYFEIRSINISNDGAKMFMSGPDEEVLRSYTLSTPWDLSSIAYDNVSYSLSVAAQPSSVKFKPDGTQFVWFDGGNYGELHTVDLATAWDLSTATAKGSVALDQLGINTSDYWKYSRGWFTFNQDGTKAYIGDDYFNNNYYIVALDLSTPYDATTASPSSINELSIFSNVKDYIYDVRFEANTVFAVSEDENNHGISEYNQINEKMDLSTEDNFNPLTQGVSEYRFKGSEFTEDKIGSVYTKNSLPLLEESGSFIHKTAPFSRGITFSPDFSKLYMLSENNIHQYNLSTPGDLNTAGFYGSAVLPSSLFYGGGIQLSSDGTKLFTKGDSHTEIFIFNLSTAYDISSASYAQSNFLSNQSNSYNDAIYDFKFSPDGLKLFVAWHGRYNDNGSYIAEYDLSNPYDLPGGISHNASTWINPSSNEKPYHFFATGIEFSSDGTKLFVLDLYGIVQLKLPTAYELTGAVVESFDQLSDLYLIKDRNNIENTGANTLSFDQTGTKLYYIGGNSADLSYKTLSEFNLYSSEQVSAFNFDNSITINPQGSASAPRFHSFAFKNDGTSFYYVDNSNYVVQHDLATAWDISTANLNADAVSPYTVNSGSGFLFKDDGSVLYILDTSGYNIIQYTLNTPWVISSLQTTGITYVMNSYIGSNVEKIIHVSHDGTKLLAKMDPTPYGYHEIRLFDIPTPWDFSSIVSTNYETVEPIRSKFLSVHDDYFKTVNFTNNGLNAYLLKEDLPYNSSSFAIIHLTLSEPYNLNSIITEKIQPLQTNTESSYDLYDPHINLERSLFEGFVFEESVNKMFFLNNIFEVIECSVSNNEIGSFGSEDVFNNITILKNKIEDRSNQLLALTSKNIVIQG